MVTESPAPEGDAAPRYGFQISGHLFEGLRAIGHTHTSALPSTMRR
jgi:hypothetical protein